MNVKKKIITVLVIFLLIFASLIGYSLWVISNDINVKPVNKVEQVLTYYFDGNDATYNGGICLPSAIALGLDDAGIISESDLTYRYKLSSETTFRPVTQSDGPINAGEYNIEINYRLTNTTNYVKVVTFTINKAIAYITQPEFEKTEYFEYENPEPINLIKVTSSDGSEIQNASIVSNLNDFVFEPSSSAAFQTKSIVFSFIDPNYETTTTSPVELKVKPVCYKIQSQNTYYGSLKRCLDATSNGDIVSFIPATDNDYDSNNLVNSTNKVEYRVNENCVIKEGVTLIVPTGKNKVDSVTNSSTFNTYLEQMYQDQRDKGVVNNTSTSFATYRSLAKTNQERYLRTTIYIDDNVEIINNGTLVIAGYLSGGDGSSASMISHTSHSYSRIIIGANAKITQSNSNAKLHCYGYIEEQTKNNGGVVTINAGTVYMPFVVADYKGFSMSWAMTVNAINTHRCSPFNRIELKNIETKFLFRYGASLIGRVNLQIIYSSANVDEPFPKDVNIVGSTSSFFLQLTDQNNSYFESKLDVNTNKLKLDLYGGAKLNPLVLNFSQSPVSVDLSTTNAYFPLSLFFDVECHKTPSQQSATYDLTQQRTKLLPGAKLKINNGCALQASEIIVYSAFLDGTTFVGSDDITKKDGPSYPLQKGGEFIIEDGATVVATKLAGTIYANASNSIQTQNTSMNVKEPWRLGNNPDYSIFGSSSYWTIANFLEIYEELQIVPLSNLNLNKIYVGNNTFTNVGKTGNYILGSSNKTNFNVIYNETSAVNINGIQKVIFTETLNNYDIEFLNNVYKFFKQRNASQMIVLQMGENVVVSGDTIIGAVQSSVPISNNATVQSAQVNEFEVQSITIECITPLVNGQIPLHPNKDVSLEANVVDINKVYDKTITWHSSDNSIATIDNNGKLSGVAEGRVTITATCMGVSVSREFEVLPDVVIPSITTITLKYGNTTVEFPNLPGNTDSKSITIKNNVNQVVSVTFDAPWSSIKWTYSGTGEARNYMTLENGTTPITTAENVEKVRIRTTNESTGTDPDPLSLKMEVVDLNGNKQVRTIKFSHDYFSVCVTSDTLITLAEGTKKKVGDLLPTDLVLAYNHETGQLEAEKIAYIVSHDENDVEHLVLKLEFSNNMSVEIIGEHIFFDATLNRYVAITYDNFKDYINDEFVVINSSGEITKTILIGGFEEVKMTRSFEVVTYKKISCFTNDILSASAYVLPLLNIFEFVQDEYIYNEEMMRQDIEQYGLYTYSDFEHLISETVFEMYNAAYLKIAVGKGYITWENIVSLIEFYYSLNITPLC